MVDELRKIAGANMLDYMKSTPEGDPYLDFSALTRDQGAVRSSGHSCGLQRQIGARRRSALARRDSSRK